MVSTGADEAAQRAECLPSLAWSCAEGDIPRHDGRLKQEGERLKVISGYIVTSIIPWGTEHFAKQTNKKKFFFPALYIPEKSEVPTVTSEGTFSLWRFSKPLGFPMPVDTSDSPL